MKIELPTREQIEFYSKFPSFKIINKGKYNEYISLKTSDIQSVIELTELQRKYISLCERSVEKGCITELSFETYKDMLSKPCAYCGDKSYSIDRIDSEKCYLLNNIQQTCTKCNMMKYILSDKDFKEHIFKIYNYIK